MRIPPRLYCIRVSGRVVSVERPGQVSAWRSFVIQRSPVCLSDGQRARQVIRHDPIHWEDHNPDQTHQLTDKIGNIRARTSVHSNVDHHRGGYMSEGWC